LRTFLIRLEHLTVPGRTRAKDMFILPFGAHRGAGLRASAGRSSSVTWDAERIWAGGTHFLWMQMGGQVSTVRVLDQG